MEIASIPIRYCLQGRHPRDKDQSMREGNRGWKNHTCLDVFIPYKSGINIHVMHRQ